MQQVNRYFRFAKISEARFRQLLRCFALDLSASQTAKMTGISVRSVNPIFQRLREKLAQECEKLSPFSGDLEADESYFGPHRVRGKRGRGADRKQSSSDCSNATTRSTRKSCRMSQEPLYKR